MSKSRRTAAAPAPALVAPGDSLFDETNLPEPGPQTIGEPPVQSKSVAKRLRAQKAPAAPSPLAAGDATLEGPQSPASATILQHPGSQDPDPLAWARKPASAHPDVSYFSDIPALCNPVFAEQARQLIAVRERIAQLEAEEKGLKVGVAMALDLIPDDQLARTETGGKEPVAIDGHTLTFVSGGPTKSLNADCLIAAGCPPDVLAKGYKDGFRSASVRVG